MTRRFFFGWGTAALAALSAIPLFLNKDKKKKTKTAKMLTRDGKLVEVDISHLQSRVRLASKKEMQTWVWPDADHSRPKPLK